MTGAILVTISVATVVVVVVVVAGTVVGTGTGSHDRSSMPRVMLSGHLQVKVAPPCASRHRCEQGRFWHGFAWAGSRAGW